MHFRNLFLCGAATLLAATPFANAQDSVTGWSFDGDTNGSPIW